MLDWKSFNISNVIEILKIVKLIIVKQMLFTKIV